MSSNHTRSSAPFAPHASRYSSMYRRARRELVELLVGRDARGLPETRRGHAGGGGGVAGAGGALPPGIGGPWRRAATSWARSGSQTRFIRRRMPDAYGRRYLIVDQSELG